MKQGGVIERRGEGGHKARFSFHSLKALVQLIPEQWKLAFLAHFLKRPDRKVIIYQEPR